LAVTAAGCKSKTHDEASAENNGVYVNAGPVTYQLQVSRALNQYATEDSQYLAGLPAGAASLGPNQLWYGVFLWAKNQQKVPEKTATNFVLIDTEGNHYYPVPLNRALNPYVWTSQTLNPGGIEPGPDTTASFGPTQGELLLFKLNTSVYDNRPLTLEILGPTRRVWGSISLDL
jgi:hypothetical protein